MRVAQVGGAWFDRSEDALALAASDGATHASWRWLAIVLATVAIAVPALWLLCRALPSFLARG